MALDRTILLEARPLPTTLDLAGNADSLWQALREGDPERLNGDALAVTVAMRELAR